MQQESRVVTNRPVEEQEREELGAKLEAVKARFTDPANIDRVPYWVTTSTVMFELSRKNYVVTLSFILVRSEVERHGIATRVISELSAMAHSLGQRFMVQSVVNPNLRRLLKTKFNAVVREHDDYEVLPFKED